MAYIGKRPVDTFPANNAVTASIISANAVGSSEIANSAVGVAELAADSVTGAKIADNAVDSEHYTDGSIDTAHIADAQITTAKITDVNVTTAKIADDAVTLAKLAGIARGKIIYGDASGNPAVLAPGTNGQVLKSDGTDVSWGTDTGLTTEEVQDIAGGMFSSNTETGITATYQDSDGTVDLVVGTLNQDTTGLAGTATALATARTIHGVSFDGTANIDLSEVVQDTAGGMFSSNTETGITATYQDSDGTIDLVVGTLNQDTTGTAATVTGGTQAAITTAANLTTVGTIGTGVWQGTAIASAYIAGDAITGAKIADDAVDSEHYTDGSIDTAHIADDQITNAKMADDAIDSAQIADGSIDTAHIADDQVTAAKLANTAVTAASYGSSSAIPVLTVDAQGRITAATTAATSSTLTIAADSGSNDTVTVGTDTLTFAGTSNEVNTTVSNNQIQVGLPDNVTIGGNLTVTGNYTVNGTTTTVATSNMVVSDNLIELNNGAGSNANDSGIVIERGSTGDNAIFVWDESADKFIVGTTTATGASTGDLTITTGTLVGNIEGNVTGNVTGNTSGTAATVTGAAQTNITSLGTLTALTVDNLGINGNTITANSGALNLTPASGSAIVLDGTINVDAGVVTGATSITSTAFVGNLTGNVTGNTSGTAATVTTAAQTNITSLGTLTALTVDSVVIDGAVIGHTGDTDLITLSSGVVTVAGELDAVSLDISGDADIDGTLEADAITIAGVTLSETIADTVGAMVSSNTESGITVAYEDGDNTLDFTVGTLNQNTTGTAASWTTARTLSFTGDATGTGSVDGSANVATALSLAADSVDSAEIADGAIDTAHIADDQITQAKMADDAIGADQLAVNSVVSASIVNGSIVAADLADNSVTSAKIVNGTIASADIANNAILTQHIDDNQVTGDQIADDIVLSGTGAIRMPDGTTGQRPGSAAAGMFRYNTTTSKFEGYTDAWGDIGGGGSNTFSRNAFTGDGSDTTFTLSQTPDSENNLIVFIEGVFQDQDAYSVSGTTLTFGTAPVNGRGIIVYHVKSAVSGTNLSHNQFTADGSDTQFTLSITPVHENNTMVYIDGVYQNKTSYTVSGTTLDFGSGNPPPASSKVECMTMNQLDINTPVDDTISTAKIQALAVTEAKIAVNAVTSLKIAENAITARELATNAIATLFIADNSVTSVKIAQNSILTKHIDDAQITTGHIIDANVTTAKIADNAVTAAKIGVDVLTDQVAGITSAATPGSSALTIDSNEHVTIINDLIVDTSTLKVDSGNNRVGIGTASPDVLLHLKSTSAHIAQKIETTVSTGNATLALLAHSVGDSVLYFGDNTDADVGSVFYDHSSNYMAFTTNTAERMRIHASGNTSFACTSDYKTLTVGDTDAEAWITAGGVNTHLTISPVGQSGALIIKTGSTNSDPSDAAERMRIQPSGKVGIGQATPAARLDIAGMVAGEQALLITSGRNDALSNGLARINITDVNCPFTGLQLDYAGTGTPLHIKRADGTALVVESTNDTGNTGDRVAMEFKTDAAQGIAKIIGGKEGNYQSSGARSGYLAFQTINANTYVEKMRITADGYLWLRNTTANYDGGQSQMTSASTCQTMYVTNTSFADPQVVMAVERSASSAYKFFNMYSGRRPDTGGGDVEFQIRGDGNGYCDGSWSGGGADYAEYFEWSDGNASSQDRIGLSVVLDGNKIREATGSDAAGTIIGVISGNPAVVGDTAYTKWTDKYQKDDYGRYVLDSDGHRQENSDYDDSLTYVERENRKEWDTVGLMGKLRMKKGQQTGTNWIKMRDISASVEEWLVR